MTWRTATALAVAALIPLISCGRAPQSQSPEPLASPEIELPSTVQACLDAKRQGRADLFEAGLLRIVENGSPDEQKRALAMLGIYNLDRHRPDDALRFLRPAIRHYPELKPFLQWKMVEALRQTGRYAGAARTAAALVREAPESSAARLAKVELPALEAAAGRPQDAVRALGAVASVEIGPFVEPEFDSTAVALQNAGLIAEADALRMRILREYPQGRTVEKVYRELSDSPLDPLDRLDYKESLDLADRLGRFNRYDQALALLDRIRSRFPERSDDATFRYERITSLFHSRHYETVRAATLDPSQPYYVSLEIYRAHAWWRSGGPEEFVHILNRILAQYPKSDQAPRAKLLLAKYYVTDEIDYPKSISLLRQVIDSGHPGTDGENIWTLGWVYTLAGMDDQALATFDLYLRRYPDADYTSNSLFWSAKVLRRCGRIEEADTRLRKLIDLVPYSYYAYRAKEILGVDPAAFPDAASSEPFPSIAMQLPPDDPRLALIGELETIGLEKEAAIEMRQLVESRPDDLGLSYALARLYVRAGEPLRANAILQRKFRDVIRHGASGVPDQFWQILYPRSYWQDIESAAQRQGIDPYLVTAIIRQESGFEPSIVSNAGAVGLMQLMPQEARSIASRAGLPTSVDREQLFDPATNIRLGTAEFAQKRTAMNGDVILAIAAYNAGESAVGRWLAQTPLGDLDLFIESIPYAETRLYVKTVTRNRYEYRRIYDPDQATPRQIWQAETSDSSQSGSSR